MCVCPSSGCLQLFSIRTSGPPCAWLSCGCSDENSSVLMLALTRQIHFPTFKYVFKQIFLPFLFFSSPSLFLLLFLFLVSTASHYVEFVTFYLLNTEITVQVCITTPSYIFFLNFTLKLGLYNYPLLKEKKYNLSLATKVSEDVKLY